MKMVLGQLLTVTYSALCHYSPSCCPLGPLSTWTTMHQDHNKPGQLLTRTTTLSGGQLVVL